MKLKLYLRMILAVMTAMFTMTGCSSSTEEEPVGPNGVALTFQLEVSEVGSGNATVAVKPSDAMATYYCGAIEKSVYDAFATEADFFAADVTRLQGIATQNKMTLKAYLEMYAHRGEGNRTVKTTVATAEHYAYVYGIKTDGTVTSKVFKSEFVSGGVAVGPVVEAAMWPGDGAGANKSVMLSLKIAVTGAPAVSSKYYFNTTSKIEEAIAAGETYESLVAKSENAFTADMIAKMNTVEGLTGVSFGSVAKPLPANTSYTLIVLAVDAKGVEGVAHASASTEPAGGGGTGPTVTLTLRQGLYPSGGDLETQFHVIIESAPMDVTTGKLYINETANVQLAIDAGLSYEAIIAQYGEALDAGGIKFINEGGLVYNYKEGAFKPGTSYTVIVSLTNPSGTSVEHKQISTAGGGGGGGDLTFTFSVTEITGTSVNMQVIPSNNTDTYYFDLDVSSAIAGLSDAQIITNCGELPSDYPSTGPDGYSPSAFETYPLEPSTEYTVYAFGYASGAATTPVAKYIFTTDSAGEPTDAYKAWLGTWTVTSAKNELDNTPVSFDVTISQKKANSTYKVIGWGISGNRLVEDAAMTFNFNSATGGFKAMNSVVLIDNFETPDKLLGTLEQTIRYYDPADGKYYSQPGSFSALIATMQADKKAANVVGGTFGFKDDPVTYTVANLDLTMWSSGYEKVWTWGPAAGFTNRPVGPYTMSKKSGSAVQARSMDVKAISMLASKTQSGKSVVVAPNIPQFSSILKVGSKNTSITYDLKTKFQSTKSSALNIAPKSDAYELIWVK